MRSSGPNLSASASSQSVTKPSKQLCGPTRNLTALYSKYRSDHKSKRSRFGYSLLGEGAEGLGKRRLDLETGEEHLLASSSRSSAASEVELKTLSPPWITVVERVKDCIAKAKEKQFSLQKLQQRRLLRVFDEEGKGDIDVETAANSISNLIGQAERGIKEIDKYMTADDQEMAVNVQRSLATQLTKVSTDFKTLQKGYMNEIVRRRQQAGGTLDDSSTSTSDVIDAGFTEDQLLELDGIESQVETRSQEIVKIARSLNELHTTMKDMAALVVEQGTVLDRIDYNMENVVKSTAEANKELVKAEETQKSSRVQKCILALVAFIVLNLLLIFARA